MRTHILVGLVFVVACTSFDAIDRGVCGNGLLEPGEDCDDASSRCVACRIACASTADCPAAYACGVDDTCHAPAARFAPATAPQPFAASTVAVTDLDRDGIGDVLGVSQTAVEIRYGDPTGLPTRADHVLTPIQSGTLPAIADLDGDGTLDVATTSADGAVVYTSPFGKPTPLASRLPLEVPGYQVQTIVSIDHDTLGVLATKQTTGKLELLVVSLLGGGNVLGITDSANPAAQLCGGRFTADDFSPSRYDITTTSDLVVFADAELAITPRAATGATCVTQIQINLVAAQPDKRAVFVDVSPTSHANVPTGAHGVFAKLDGDASNACPALVYLGSTAATIAEYPGQSSGGHCIVAAAPTTLPISGDALPPPGAIAVGHVPATPTPFVPTLPLQTWGRDALVLSDGVYGVLTSGNAPAAIAKLYSASRTISHVTSGDFNGDGAIDAVTTTDGEDDVDVLYRHTYSLLPFRVDTATHPIATLVGDFDGNAIDDIAYVEPIEGHQRLSIAYGTTDGLTAPIEVESFGSVKALTVVAVPTSLDQSDIIDDIAVLDQSDPTALPQLTALFGSAQRTMLSFFDPRSSKAAGDTHIDATASLAGIVVGHWRDGADPEAVVFGDVSAFAPARASSPPGIYGWPMTISADGLALDGDAYGVALDHFVACGNGAAATTDVCLDSALYAVVPLSATHDAVVAIDRQEPHPSAAVIVDGAVVLAPQLVANVPPGAVIRSIHATSGQLVIAFGTDAERTLGSVGLVEACPFDTSGHATGACVDLGAQLADHPTCIDAAPSDFGLALLCYAGPMANLYRADTGEVVASGLAALRGFTIADVTGDGVGDLVGLTGDALVVYPQCTTTELECGR